MQGLTTILLSPLVLFGATTIQSSVCNPISEPAITSPAAGEIDAGSTFVTGTADDGTTVAVQIDGNTVATTTADSGNSFGVTITLTAGERALRAVASNPCESKASATVDLTVIGAPDPGPTDPGPSAPQPTPTPTPSPSPGGNQPLPTDSDKEKDGKLRLSIDPALDGSIVDTPSVYVSGTLSRPGTVTLLVDGEVVAELKASDRVFGFRVPLELGENTITIRAKSGDQSTQKTLTITRVPVGQATGQNQDGQGTGEAVAWYESPVMYIVVAAAVVVGGVTTWLIASGRLVLMSPKGQ